MISDLPWSEKNREWVGMDVDIVESTEEDEVNAMLDTGEVSEGEGIYQNADKQEDENSSSIGGDLQENRGIEQQLASGEKLSEPEDSVIENPLENIDRSEETLVPDDETRGEKLLEPESAHVIVDEEVDFDQFGSPPPDLPIIGNVDREQRGGIGSPDGEKGASRSTEVKRPEEQITGLDADDGSEQGMKNLNDDQVKASLKGAEQEEQVLIERDPQADADSKPADNEDYDVPRDLDTEPTAGRNGNSELRQPETGNSDNSGDASSESALRNLNTKTEEEGCSAQEELQKRSEDLNQLTQEHAIQIEDLRHQVDLSNARLEEQYEIHGDLRHQVDLLNARLEEQYEIHGDLRHQVDLSNARLEEQYEIHGDLRHQVDLSNARLEEQYEINEDLKRKLETECDERLKSDAKLMVLHEILPNMEEKLKILSDQVQFLEFQLLEQANSRNKLENDLQQERKENTQYLTQLEEQARLQEEITRTLHEERNGRLRSDTGLMVLRELFTNTEDNMKDLRDQVDSLVAQLQQETELRKSVEERLDWESKERMQHMTKVEEQSKMHEDFSLKMEEERDERLKSETYLEELRENTSNEEKLKDLHNQVVLLTAQLQEQKQLKNELEGDWDHELEGRMQDAGTLPVSSMPWSEEKLEFEKLLDEQKTLLANQVQEAEMLRNAAEMKVGLLNHQVQNLEVLTDIAETMESAFSAKERVIKQTLWTAFQALCLGVGFMSFVVAYRDPSRSSLKPT